ncbi:tRNA(Ile)(2)-agmatinylcytidine synthase [Picrophilus oshimae]|uniref:tRNA(Ile2) 2-agmatinylcytidine synthetase TiaS n=1 Tax=Picrophilus torridus (strain ATCC 700027 / DSM 9790 / JCM 10055 / NBRC 100828 / KAW 2/3) TaxID=1122961 RepID=Q6KZ90_PICTO|nr:tRNA(Ile)(2)-agmatinylcytidine synthase [Picrophilus oshimae]AAT43962.1 hypothetical protein PTO1377 [Picrophilus oshimae DSM 9789]
MYLAIDDTDSGNSMCTTYIIERIITESKYDIIGYPELVRLNPNISYKTRGNGALNINLGRGSGEKILIGFSSGRKIYGFERMYMDADEDDVIEMASSIVGDLSELDDPKTNPGIVVSNERLDEHLYKKALQEDININYIENIIKNKRYKKFKNGHGIIGAAASLAWNKKRVTYELLNYRYPHYENIEKDKKMDIAMIPEKYQSTFNNIDYKNKYPAIFPKPKTPVIFGIRGISRDDIFKSYMEIRENYKIDDEAAIIYKTNQGTDDHILNEPELLNDLGSYRLTGTISSMPFSIEGGHHFIGFTYHGYSLYLAAFEPTKEFRHVIDSLIPGDIVSAYGSLDGNTLKLEKIDVIYTADLLKNEPPFCTKCNVKTRSKGKNDYRCPVCGARYHTPRITKIKRGIEPGRYEVPVIARRHLSMPLKLASHFGLQ